MKLTIEDKEILTKWGYPESDFKQIEKAITKTIYETKEGKITKEEALNILGKREFLSGIARSAFHWSACRNNEKGQIVYFNSSKLFE